MQLTPAISEFRQLPWSVEKLTTWKRAIKNKTITDWTIEHLNIQPYQHLLEIGYTSGYTLSETARKLKIGFLAGIDESMTMYRRAYRRNKKLIRDQLLQLHIGQIHELPYPHHYFHTIYGNNSLYSYVEESGYTLIPLVNLLRSGGKLVMVFQPGTTNEKEVLKISEKIKQDYIFAGLSRIQLELRDMHPVTAVAITGYKE